MNKIRNFQTNLHVSVKKIAKELEKDSSGCSCFHAWKTNLINRGRSLSNGHKNVANGHFLLPQLRKTLLDRRTSLLKEVTNIDVIYDHLLGTLFADKKL